MLAYYYVFKLLVSFFSYFNSLKLHMYTWFWGLDDEWSSLDKKARVSSGFSMGTPDSGKTIV